MVFDILVAGISVGIAAVIALSAITVVHRSRQATDRLNLATMELNNQLERASAIKWEELTPGTLEKVQLSDMAAQQIPGSKLELSVTNVSEPRRAKKLDARIKWPDRDQLTYAPLHLTAWVFDQRETP
jgi:hypothetical protein